MATGRRFARGVDYPNEGFVQSALEAHFKAAGFHREPGGHADLVCRDPRSGQRWIIETKGLTTAVGLDFRTGLGQLIQRMRDESASYAIAVPNIPQFVTQCRDVPAWVRRSLRLHWLIVDESGKVWHCDANQDL